MFKKIRGTNNFYYVSIILRLAGAYCKLNQYNKSKKLFGEAVETAKVLFENCKGDNDECKEIYIIALTEFAMFYRNTLDYKTSQRLLIKVFFILGKIDEKNYDEYIRVLDNLAEILCFQGKFSEAEKKYLETLSTLEILYGRKSLYAKTLIFLAGQYRINNYYARVEQLLTEAYDILSELQDVNNPINRIIITDLAVYYFEMGQFDKAKKIILNEINQNKFLLKNNPMIYSGNLLLLANLYIKTDQFNKADIQYKKASKILRRDSSNPLYANVLGDMAELRRKTGNYDEAVLFCRKAMILRKNIFGEKHPEYVFSLNSVALIYDTMKKYREAETLYKCAINTASEIRMENHPDFANILNNLAILYYKTDRTTMAYKLYKKINLCLLQQLKNNYEFLSESERQQHFITVAHCFEIFNSIGLNIKKDKSFFGHSYDNELALKGVQLLSFVQMKNSIFRSGDIRLVDTFNKWLLLKRQMTEFNLGKLDSVFFDVSETEEKLTRYEKELLRTSKSFKKAQVSFDCKWGHIQKALKSDEAAIEFIRFNYFNGLEYTKIIKYCALIILPQKRFPLMVELATEGEIIKQIPYIWKTDFPDLNNLQKLYDLIWEPIDIKIKGVKTIYYSPTGVLLYVPFNSIITRNNTLLGNEYEFHQLNSTREILHLQKNKKDIMIKDAALFGGIQYEIKCKNQKKETVTLLQNTGDFQSLPWTLHEVHSIGSLLKKCKIKTISIKTGVKATSKSFLSIEKKEKSPELIHISTHGYYFPSNKNSSEGNLYITSADPLIRSGLIMAGGNVTWRGGKLPQVFNSGVLSAREISEMNLSNTKLVILSACKSGRGDIRDYEGVYGLQRAFKMAGVQNLIIALWEIDQYTSRHFMERFYLNLIVLKKHLRAAFIKTINEIRQEYNEPKYWAGFILIEG
ncbi:MAG TPA: CHAT domain-containing protein [Bacteroidales bacterium]|nr:CHAT domain-containing protein [Bacteroidales bacterium]